MIAWTVAADATVLCMNYKLTVMSTVMKRILLFLAIVFMAGCSQRRGVDVTVNRMLAVEYPDSACRLLLSMDTVRMTRVERARRTLLLGLAQTCRGYTLAGKAAIGRAMRFYEHHGSADERADAWYTYAKANAGIGEFEEAIRGYTQSAIFAEKALGRKRRNDDPERRTTEMLLVAVYHTLGIIYFEQGYDAVEPFAKAVEAARASGNATQEGYSRFMLASSYCANGDYARAIETLSPLVEACDTIPFRYFAQMVRLQNLIFHTYQGDWAPERLLAARDSVDLDEIRTAPLSYETAVSEDSQRAFYDIASAMIFQRNGELDSARVYVDRSLARKSNVHHGDVGIYNIAAEIYHGLGDDERAYDYMQHYSAAKDSIFEVQRGAQVSELERRFRTANETAIRETSLRYRVLIALLTAMVAVMVAVWAVIAYRRKLKRRDEELNGTLALLDSYRESHDSLTSRLDASDAREAAVKRLLEGRVAAIRDIAATRYVYGDGERLAARMKELALSPAVLSDVVDMADIYSDRAVTRLRTQFAGWTERNYDFAALVIAGFSPQEICVMLDMSLNGVYTLKSKIKRRIAESSAADRDALLAFFS